MQSLVAMIKTPDEQLLQKLRQSGIQSKITSNRICVSLQASGQRHNGLIYSIPVCIQKTPKLVIINAQEQFSETGISVVCGKEGEKLQPYYLPKSGTLFSQGVQACFNTSDGCVVISIENNCVQVIEYHPSRLDHTQYLMREREIWKGGIGERKFLRRSFYEAVSAAEKKYSSIDRREIFFAIC